MIEWFFYFGPSFAYSRRHIIARHRFRFLIHNNAMRWPSLFFPPRLIKGSFETTLIHDGHGWILEGLKGLRNRIIGVEQEKGRMGSTTHVARRENARERGREEVRQLYFKRNKKKIFLRRYLCLKMGRGEGWVNTKQTAKQKTFELEKGKIKIDMWMDWISRTDVSGKYASRERTDSTRPHHSTYASSVQSGALSSRE